MSMYRASTHPVDRLSWLWLLVGATLAAFTRFQTMIPLAAWLAPVFLLRFARTQRARVALPTLAVALGLALTVALRGIFTTQQTILFGLMGMIGVLSYAVDRALADRLNGLARTLVFPCTVVLLEWAMAKSSFGSSGSVVYSQFGNLALTQVVSLAGIWGLSFLIAWLAPVVNEVWEAGLQGRVLRASVVPYVLVLAAVLTYGSLRVAFTSPQRGTARPTVRIAALAPSRPLADQYPFPNLIELAESDTLRAQLAVQSAPVIDDMFARTITEARAGAKIIVWSEAAARIRKEDEPQLLARAQVLARQEGVYLEMGLILVLRTDHFPYAENRAVLVGPAGQVLWDYAKTVQPLGDALVMASGPGILPVVDTPYGRLGTVICYDANFPTVVEQAGLARVDILLVPANDWAPITMMVSRLASYRAVENGMSLIRSTGHGITIVVDDLGEELATASYFATDSLTVTANVPMHGAATLYPRLGELPVYACAAVLLLLAGWAVIRRATGAAAPAVARSAEAG